MSGLGTYVGGRLMTDWTVFLNVYGAEESPDFEYEESFRGGLLECLNALEKFQKIIDDNYIDAYLSIQADRGCVNIDGDLETVLEELFNRDFITRSEMEEHSRFYF